MEIPTLAGESARARTNVSSMNVGVPAAGNGPDAIETNLSSVFVDSLRLWYFHFAHAQR